MKFHVRWKLYFSSKPQKWEKLMDLTPFKGRKIEYKEYIKGNIKGKATIREEVEADDFGDAYYKILKTANLIGHSWHTKGPCAEDDDSFVGDSNTSKIQGIEVISFDAYEI